MSAAAAAARRRTASGVAWLPRLDLGWREARARRASRRRRPASTRTPRGGAASCARDQLKHPWVRVRLGGGLEVVSPGSCVLVLAAPRLGGEGGGCRNPQTVRAWLQNRTQGAGIKEA